MSFIIDEKGIIEQGSYYYRKDIVSHGKNVWGGGLVIILFVGYTLQPVTLKLTVDNMIPYRYPLIIMFSSSARSSSIVGG